MKRFISAVLLASLLSMNSMPILALGHKKDATPRLNASAQKLRNKKVIQSQVSEYKFNNTNLAWWKDYKDPILESYIVKAISNNQDLKIATLRVEEARQNVKLQFSNELPSASVGVSPLMYKMPGATNSEGAFSVPIMVSYEADLFLKNHDKTKSKKKLLEVSKFNEKAAYIAVASSVGAVYFNIVKLDKLIAIQNEIIQDRKQIYNLMKMRNSQGITSTADLVRADKAYVLAQVDMSDLKKSREMMLNNLAVLIGETPNNIDELKRISYEELNAQRVIPNEISSEAITKRPDYLAAEKQVEKAGLDVRIAKKEFLPTIDILGMAAFMATSSANSMNWTNALALFGGQAMLPIFTGGAKMANLRLSKNHYEQILQTYYKTNLVAIQEVNDSLSSLKLDSEKHQKNLKSLEMQKADFKYMQSRYNQGIISGLDLLQQKENILVQRKIVAASKTDCYIDQISLYKALGGA